jgi:hypothetical protein
LVHAGQSNSNKSLIERFGFSKEDEHIIFARLLKEPWSWNIGKMECWNVGLIKGYYSDLIRQRRTINPSTQDPLFHFSSIPIFHRGEAP